MEVLGNYIRKYVQVGLPARARWDLHKFCILCMTACLYLRSSKLNLEKDANTMITGNTISTVAANGTTAIRTAAATLTSSDKKNTHNPMCAGRVTSSLAPSRAPRCLSGFHARSCLLQAAFALNPFLMRFPTYFPQLFGTLLTQNKPSVGTRICSTTICQKIGDTQAPCMLLATENHGKQVQEIRSELSSRWCFGPV